MKLLKMMTLPLKASVIAFMSVTSAFAVDFPSAGGDIASPSDWGETLPGSADPVTFTKSGTYMASADVTFGKMTVTAPEVLFDFSETPNRVIGNSVESTDTAASMTLAKDVKLTFRKGTWYSSSAAGGGNVSLGAGTSRGSLTVDGACVTNFAYFYVASGGGNNNRLTLTNNAVLQCAQFVLSRTQTGNKNEAVLSTGSRLKVTGNLLTEWYGTKSTTSGYNSFLATGNGTTVDAGAFYIGNRHDGNQIRFTDGAKLTAGTLQYGHSSNNGTSPGSDGNVMVVDNGASVEVGDCNVGYDTINSSLIVSNAASLSASSDVKVGVLAGATNHTLLVGENSTFAASKGVVVGEAASDNALIVSNAAACRITSSLVVGSQAGADRNLFAVYGDYASGDFSLSSFNFGLGSFNRIVLSGEMTLSRDGDNPYWSAESSNNVIRLENGASYTLHNVWLGGKAAGCNNRVEIGAGAQLTTYRFHTTGVGNALVISNGTYIGTSTSATGIGDTGEENRNYVPPTDNFLRLEGNCPAVRFTTANNTGLRVCSNSWIEVSVPAGGYLENHVPITGGKFSIDATCDIRFELDAYLAALGDERGSVTIVDAERDITVPDEVLARANARLPERCKLVLENGYKLVLKTKSTKGLVLILR